MAHYAQRLFSLFLMALTFSLHIEARESVFFSKATHKKGSTNDHEIVLEAPLLAPAPAPETSGTDYGLFGHESSQLPTTTATNTISDDELNNVQTEKLTENYKVEETSEYPAYSNNKYYNTNGYSRYNYNNNGYNNNYENNGYGSEKLGMSDTRVLENGKYYSNAKNENNYYGSNYGNSENEFDTMEEYERQQGYPETEIQGEYTP